MNTSRLFRNFVFLFSLIGMGSFAWGERYETVFVYTEDQNTMNKENAKIYLESSACVSTQTLTVPEGQIAYIFSSGAIGKPSGTISNTGVTSAFITGVLVDKQGLDGNLTFSSWDAKNTNFDSTSNNTLPTNINSGDAPPMSGPCTIKIICKPLSARSSTWAVNPAWLRSDGGSWDFQASEGYVTFRIVGSEQALSKKFATVIPENASTNIRVVLEQSTDLINWTTAAPGVFPPSTAKRFFRVRSEEE
jgi:hypothetical protein